MSFNSECKEVLMCPKIDCVLGSDRYEKDTDENFNPKVCMFCRTKLEVFDNDDGCKIIPSSRRRD